MKKYFKAADFGILGGVGIDFNLTNSIKMIVEGRYSYGLADVHKVVPDETDANYTMKNRGFSFLVGFSFTAN
jgi:opacity protein-like surface antigen